MNRLEINGLTGEVTETPLNAKEIKELEIMSAQFHQSELEKKAEAKANASAKSALLAKLGITDDEAKLLLG